MKPSRLSDLLLERLNARALSMLCAFVLICAAIYMSFAGLSGTGSINLKAAVVEGKIETGSLALLAMFLGALIVLALNLNKPFRGQEIRLVVNGNEISGKGLSYRKMQELVQVVSVSGAEVRTSPPAKITTEEHSRTGNRAS